MGKSIEVGNLSSEDSGQRFSFVKNGTTTVTGRIVSITHTKQRTMIAFIKDHKAETLVVDQPHRNWIRVLYGHERA